MHQSLSTSCCNECLLCITKFHKFWGFLELAWN